MIKTKKCPACGKMHSRKRSPYCSDTCKIRDWRHKQKAKIKELSGELSSRDETLHEAVTENVSLEEGDSVKKTIVHQFFGDDMYAHFLKYCEELPERDGFELNRFIRSNVSDLGCNTCQKRWQSYKTCCFVCFLQATKVL